LSACGGWIFRSGRANHAIIQGHPCPRRQTKGRGRCSCVSVAQGCRTERIGETQGRSGALADRETDLFCGVRLERRREQWPGFEAAFLGFEPKRLLFQPDEFWSGLADDVRIVRNPQKIMAVRHNAQFVSDIADQHGSFGKFLASWPADNQVGLLECWPSEAHVSAGAAASIPEVHRQGLLHDVE